MLVPLAMDCRSSHDDLNPDTIDPAALRERRRLCPSTLVVSLRSRGFSAILRQSRRIPACGACTLAPLDETGILGRPTTTSENACLRRWYSRFARGDSRSLRSLEAAVRADSPGITRTPRPYASPSPVPAPLGPPLPLPPSSPHPNPSHSYSFVSSAIP